MTTLITSSRFLTSTPSPPATKITSIFTTFPSKLSFLRPVSSVRCSISGTNSKDEVVVVDRLNNIATPWLMLPPVADETTGEKLDCFYSLADGQTVRLNRKKSLKVPDSTKCIASTMGWLGFVDTKDGSLYLSNPFVNDIVELPSLEKLPYVLGVQRDSKTDEILNFKFRLSLYEVLWGGHDLDPYAVSNPEFMAHHISNLALSFPDPRSEDCTVMALQGENVKRLAYCPIARKFNSDWEFDSREDYNDCWIGLQEDEYHPTLNSQQIVYSECRHLFYSMAEEHGLMAFDVQSDRGQRSKKVSQFSDKDLQRKLNLKFYEDGEKDALMALRRMCHHINYLVTFENGDLLLIVRHYHCLGDTYKTVHLDIFKVSYPSELERISSVGDRAIFIGRNQSFAIKARASPGVKPDSIYFTDDLKNRPWSSGTGSSRWGHDNGIFNIKDGTITTFYPYNDPEEEKKVSLSESLSDSPFWVAPLSLYVAQQHGLGDEDLCAEA